MGKGSAALDPASPVVVPAPSPALDHAPVPAPSPDPATEKTVQESSVPAATASSAVAATDSDATSASPGAATAVAPALAAPGVAAAPASARLVDEGWVSNNRESVMELLNDDTKKLEVSASLAKLISRLPCGEHMYAVSSSSKGGAAGKICVYTKKYGYTAESSHIVDFWKSHVSKELSYALKMVNQGGAKNIIQQICVRPQAIEDIGKNDDRVAKVFSGSLVSHLSHARPENVIRDMGHSQVTNCNDGVVELNPTSHKLMWRLRTRADHVLWSAHMDVDLHSWLANSLESADDQELYETTRVVTG